MSNKTTIARTATAIAHMETALEATRKEHAAASTTRIETKITNLSHVVYNTRRKMNHPAGFDWALHHAFKVVSINDTHIHAQATKRPGGETVLIDIPRSDLSLSTWQITGAIRRASAERHLANLKTTVTDKQRTANDNRKEVTAAKDRLQQSENALSEAKAAVDRRLARNKSIESKREATRARRKASTLKAS